MVLGQIMKTRKVYPLVDLGTKKRYNHFQRVSESSNSSYLGVVSGLVALPDFKSGGGLTKSMVGSIPIYSRQKILAVLYKL